MERIDSFIPSGAGYLVAGAQRIRKPVTLHFLLYRAFSPLFPCPLYPARPTNDERTLCEALEVQHLDVFCSTALRTRKPRDICCCLGLLSWVGPVPGKPVEKGIEVTESHRYMRTQFGFLTEHIDVNGTIWVLLLAAYENA